MNCKVKKKGFWWLVACAVLAMLFAGSAHQQGLQPKGEFVPGELLVKFNNDIRAGSSQLSSEQIGAQVIHDFSSIGWKHVHLPQGMTVSDGIAFYQSLPGVVAAQPNYVYHTDITPNDPQFSSLYGLAKIQAPAVWDKTTGSSSVVVAVIDTGVLYTHEDLSANMWRNPGETGLDANGHDRATNGVDDDGNSYVDDVYGINTIYDNSNPVDDNGHGTHVAGTIGAVGNNGKGVAGVNWSVRIMAVKSHDSHGNGTSASVVAAFQYVTMMKQRGVNIRVTNNSWGGAPEAASYDQALKDAIDAAGNAGILNVMAAGNSNSNNDATPFYPASYDSPSIIAVAASDQNDNRASFSSYGAHTVALAAPGVGILSTYGSGPTVYQFLSGTSMATPHVAGAAALLCAYRGALSVADLKATLMNSVDVLPQWSGLTVTGGRLNLARAVQSLPNNNPLDDAQFFVTQHYSDFLGRAPDQSGLNYWTSQIGQCGSDQTCIRNERIDVSDAFFFEQEYQQTGAYVLRLYRAAYGNNQPFSNPDSSNPAEAAKLPSYGMFAPDRMRVIGSSSLAQSQLDLANAFVERPEFLAKYPGNLTASQYVGAVLQTIHNADGANLSSQTDALIALYNSGGRGAVMYRLADDNAQTNPINNRAFVDAEYDRAFVFTEYAGYLRRDPDIAGFVFWFGQLSNCPILNVGAQHAMVCSFITSAEYQQRFSLVVTRTNAECPESAVCSP